MTSVVILNPYVNSALNGMYYVYFKNLSEPETFLLLKISTAHILEDIYLYRESYHNKQKIVILIVLIKRYKQGKWWLI